MWNITELPKIIIKHEQNHISITFVLLPRQAITFKE